MSKHEAGAPANALLSQDTTSYGQTHLSPHYSPANQKQPSSVALACTSQFTPPLTPQTTQPPDSADDAQDNFHNYLRAFHHFHPSSTISSDTEESSITVPINQGDVILVHSIQPNGWADGTLLSSGSRGWLPTNYCEAYDNDMIRNLLDALTYVWEFIRSHEDGDSREFVKQDYVRAMIAGVRLLLERSDCLTRDAPLVKTHVGLRKLRKSILGDLAAFVKAAKFLQDTCRREAGPPPDDVFDLLDSIVLKAFKVVTRAVKFLDLWTQDVYLKRFVDLRLPQGSPPLTPLSDKHDSNAANAMSQPENDAEAKGPLVEPGAALLPHEIPDSDHQHAPRYTSNINPPISLHSEGRPASMVQKRSSVSHRLSYSTKPPTARHRLLASERLCAAHDGFLSSLGAFVGHHLQSRSSFELLITTQQAVAACEDLIRVVDEVWERDSRRSTTLDDARHTLESSLSDLVQSIHEHLTATEGAEETGVFMNSPPNPLVEVGTLCVRSAGICSAITKAVIERIGDFDYEPIGLGISDFSEQTQIAEQSDRSLSGSRASLSRVDSKELSPHSLGAQPTVLPASTERLAETKLKRTAPPAISTGNGRNSSETVVYRSSSLRSSLSRRSQKIPSLEIDIPPVSPLQFPEPPSSAPHNISTFRAVSDRPSVAESTSTRMSSLRNSETSIVSDVPTNATTPEQSPVKEKDSGDLSGGSSSSISDERPSTIEEFEDAEAQLLTTTYAHELVFTKDGQVGGGSLPALVERLTTHDSTPEAMFVNTFYLTFRLFTTPTAFAGALVDRFDYIGMSPAFATPVRLRVYNVFKGWLETHWRPDTDADAIELILAFANDKLKPCLPSAGKRLVELVGKVSTTPERALVPRLVSAMGKTNTAVTSTVAPDAPLPSPTITKSQLNLLRKAESGSVLCSILDFEPLELARQFTIIESKIFCSIQPEELLASEWMKKTDSKAINVRAMSTLSTDLANLVADTILQPEEPKKRAAVVKQWVKIAKKCRELNNYDSLLAIICSLNSSMVARLKRTWDLLQPKTLALLDELRSIVDCSRNYSNLRQVLQNHVAPCIPFVGIYLTDLTFVDVGNQTKRQLMGGLRQGSCSAGADDDADGMSVINFDKHMKTSKIIGDLQRFQIPYRLAPVPEMQDWMMAQIQRVRTSDQANVQTFYRRSLLLEPREPQPPRTSPPIPEGSSANASFSSTASSGSTGKDAVGSFTTKEKFESWSARHFPHGIGHHSKEKIAS